MELKLSMRAVSFPAIAAVTLFLAACALHEPKVSDSDVLLREAIEDGEGKQVGSVRFTDSPFGLMIFPELNGLEPGPHAAHIHENPGCGTGNDGSPAGAAGNHYDPDSTNRHAGPYGDGHRGDLPNLVVEEDGTARIPALAPRLKAAEIKGRSLMIHAGADRFDTHSMHHHGTGGPRMYCGVIQ